MNVISSICALPTTYIAMGGVTPVRNQYSRMQFWFKQLCSDYETFTDMVVRENVSEAQANWLQRATSLYNGDPTGSSGGADTQLGACDVYPFFTRARAI